MRPWRADVEIDVELVRSLLVEQFPELDASSARLLGEGWDNSVWVVEGQWAFRFPRREIAIPGVERELAVLPLLAPLLAVAIPEPRFVGVPSERFAWPFFGAQLLPGSEPADAGLGDEERIELGAALGRFLRALHDVELDIDLPVDPNRREDMVLRCDLLLENLGRLGDESARKDVERLLSDARALPAPRERVLLHGDLHLRHVLVDRARLSGVIDWGDVCVGDRSIDLSLYWALLPPLGRHAFLAEYGPIDKATRLRARVLSLQLCSMLAVYARDVGHESLARESVAGLERTLLD